MTWQAGGTETTWVLQYSTDQSTWQDVQVNTNPTYTLQNLDGNKVYYVRVLAHCGGNDYSIPSNVYSFRTDCPEYQSIPFSEDFDSYESYDPYGGGGGEVYKVMSSSDRMPPCWSSLNESEYYENSDYPYIYYDGGNETESNVLKFYVYNDGEEETIYQYAILPAMQNVSGLQLRFKAVAGESSGWAPFSIGVLSDPTDSESFVEIQSYAATDAWDSYVVYLDQYEGDGEYIAIKIGTPGQWSSYILYIDDVEVSELPTCFVPTYIDFNPSSITDNSVMIGWEPYGDETAWEIQYSNNKTNWTSIPVTNQNATINDGFVIYTIEDLLANNLYYVRVRANCGNGDYSDFTNLIQIRTDCGEYQPIPYYEDFESFDLSSWPHEYRLPPCWTYINQSNGQYTSNQAYPSIQNDAGSSSTKYLYFLIIDYDYLNHHYGYDPQPEYAIMPEMESLDGVVLKFSGKGEEDNYWLDYYHTIVVGYIDDNNDLHPVQSIELNESRYTEYTVGFNYPGSGRIYFMLDVPGTHGTRMYHSIAFIDNIFVANHVTNEVEGYTADDNGWNLIASPVVGSISPLSVDNMTNENYDLYAFDQAAEGGEWRNYKANAFMLENGQGYLYANDNNITLSFAGAMQPAASVEVPLVYVEGKPFAGWNLVGNPFDCSATIAGDPDYYRINGNTLVVSSGEVEMCEGVFVHASTTGQSVIFERTDAVDPGVKGALNLGLYKGSMLRCIDRARIRFNDGENLAKLNLLSDPNKLYIPLDGIDYAAVHTGAMGELPLNLNAAENGFFTLAADLEELELNYLHLIDNLTGKDINLLETPSYTFEAKSSDYASRFKVVFSIGGSEGENFAFMRNGHLLILGQEGQSTLQVVDMTGRILSTETFNGSYDKAFGYSNGVYVLRLINGEEVKTQKIVIK